MKWENEMFKLIFPIDSYVAYVLCSSIKNNKLLCCSEPNKISKTMVNKELKKIKYWGWMVWSLPGNKEATD